MKPKQLEFSWMPKKPRLGKYISKGSSRAVFHSGRNTVLKLAFNQAGIDQNRAETEASQYTGTFPLAKILDHADNFAWVLQEKASTEKYPAHEDVQHLKWTLGSICGDVCLGNIGYIKGKLVAVDYGFNNCVKKLYYDPPSEYLKALGKLDDLVDSYNGGN